MRSATAGFLMPAGGQLASETRYKRCNAAEGDVARFCGIVVCLINTGDLAIFGLFGRFVAKTAVSRWNGRLFRLDVPAV
jgi:hypothetical protein